MKSTTTNNRNHEIEDIVPHGAGFDVLGKLQCGVEVASVDAGSEPVVCIVGALDDLFERIEL